MGEQGLVVIMEELRKMRSDFNEEQQQTRKLVEDKFKDEQAEKQKIIEKVEEQGKKITSLEKETKRKNIVIYGIEESKNENYQELSEKNKVVNERKNKVGLGINEVDDFFRLGKKNEQKRNRPILVKLVTNWRKNRLWK